MNIKTIALLYPGNMGSTIGAAAVTSGARVVWASERRSNASRKRAKQAGLIDVETLPNALRESDMEEIAATFKAAGLPGGFHMAAAEICQRLTPFKDQTDPAPTLPAAVGVIRGRAEKHSSLPSPSGRGRG